MPAQRVTVVGAGIGGLVAAIELARGGAEVTLLERAAGPGGKVRQAVVGDAAVDCGPTVFTMRWVFDEIFAAAGSSLDDHLALTPLDILARHGWQAGAELDLHASADRSADAIGAFSGAADARGYLAFAAEARRMYDVLREPYLDATRPNPISLAGRIGLHRLDDLWAIRPFETLWHALGRHFRDLRLRQLFGRYATYCGSSPFQAPATLMLIAHVEQDGVWSVTGGMRRLAQALESLARAQGVHVRYGAHVARIETDRGAAAGVALDTGERIGADAVVVNADPSALALGAFGAAARRATAAPARHARSLSAMTWSLSAPTDGFPLDRHNVFFSADYRAEFRDILQDRRVAGDPTIYVCAQDRGGGQSVLPGAHERLLVLVNAPADGDLNTMSPEERTACQTRVFDRLKRSGLNVRLEKARTATMTPQDFHALYPGTGGAIYGRATHGWVAAFQRPGARTPIRGLYLAGGGAHPGAGVPMAALSGRTAARTLMADWALRRTFLQAATPGGTSTPSATTAGTG